MSVTYRASRVQELALVLLRGVRLVVHELVVVDGSTLEPKACAMGVLSPPRLVAHLADFYS